MKSSKELPEELAPRRSHSQLKNLIVYMDIRSVDPSRADDKDYPCRRSSNTARCCAGRRASRPGGASSSEMARQERQTRRERAAAAAAGVRAAAEYQGRQVDARGGADACQRAERRPPDARQAAAILDRGEAESRARGDDGSLNDASLPPSIAGVAAAAASDRAKLNWKTAKAGRTGEDDAPLAQGLEPVVEAAAPQLHVGTHAARRALLPRQRRLLARADGAVPLLLALECSCSRRPAHCLPSSTSTPTRTLPIRRSPPTSLRRRSTLVMHSAASDVAGDSTGARGGCSATSRSDDEFRRAHAHRGGGGPPPTLAAWVGASVASLSGGGAPPRRGRAPAAAGGGGGISTSGGKSPSRR